MQSGLQQFYEEKITIVRSCLYVDFIECFHQMRIGVGVLYRCLANREK
jgi:hypothetical protein